MKEISFRTTSTRPLTALQTLYIDAWFEYEGDVHKIANKLDRSTEHVYGLARSNTVQLEMARRSQETAKVLLKSPDFVVSKPERLELLWGIAEKGVEMIYDKEGNQVMSSPATSVSAVRTINEMVTGSLAPKEIDITVKDDTRTEAEIRANIARLTKQYHDLAVIEGVTEDDVAQTRVLPSTSPSDDEWEEAN